MALQLVLPHKGLDTRILIPLFPRNFIPSRFLLITSTGCQCLAASMSIPRQRKRGPSRMETAGTTILLPSLEMS